VPSFVSVVENKSVRNEKWSRSRCQCKISVSWDIT